MKLEVYRDLAGRWSWNVVGHDGVAVGGSDYDSYDAAAEDAESEVRLALATSRREAHSERRRLADTTLAALSPSARWALDKGSHLADTAAVKELAAAVAAGQFDFGSIPEYGIKSKAELERFLADRQHPDG